MNLELWPIRRRHLGGGTWRRRKLKFDIHIRVYKVIFLESSREFCCKDNESLSVCLSVCLSVYLSVCLSVCLSVSPSLSLPPPLSLSLSLPLCLSLSLSLSLSRLDFFSGSGAIVPPMLSHDHWLQISGDSQQRPISTFCTTPRI